MIQDEQAAKAWLRSLPEHDEAKHAQLLTLVDLLTEENARQNLVSMASLSSMWQRHIVDSAQLLSHVPRGTGINWLDLGSGAGFPGLIVAILRPEIDMLLIESRLKRSTWLQHVVRQLGLTRTQVSASRLELVDAPPMSVISARAFAPLDRLLNLSARFSTAQTLWLLPKGRSAAHELQQLVGWQHKFHVEQSLTDHQAGIIIGQLIGQARHSK